MVSYIMESTLPLARHPALTKVTRRCILESRKQLSVGSRTAFGRTSQQKKSMLKPPCRPLLFSLLPLAFDTLDVLLPLDRTTFMPLLRSQHLSTPRGTALSGKTLPSCALSQMIALPPTPSFSNTSAAIPPNGQAWSTVLSPAKPEDSKSPPPPPDTSTIVSKYSMLLA